MARTLLRGGCVLTMGRTNHPAADVLIDGGTIVEVGPGLRARDAEVVDAADAIVMPGFVDAHRHASESLFRHTADGAGAGRRFTAEDAYAATLLGLLGALDAGITTVVDWCHRRGPGYHRSGAAGAPRQRARWSMPPPDEDWPAGCAAPQRRPRPAHHHRRRPPDLRRSHRCQRIRSGDGPELGADPRPRRWVPPMPLHGHPGAARPARSGHHWYCTHLGDADFDALAAAGQGWP
jgi:hypothetical protein